MNRDLFIKAKVLKSHTRLAIKMMVRGISFSHHHFVWNGTMMLGCVLEMRGGFCAKIVPGMLAKIVPEKWEVVYLQILSTSNLKKPGVCETSFFFDLF